MWITLRGFCEKVAALYDQQALLRYLPFDEFAKVVGKEDADTTLEHIAHSPCCSCAKTERQLGYHTRTTMETVKERLRALELLQLLYRSVEK